MEGGREKRGEKEVVGKVLSRGFSRERRAEKLQTILAEAPIVDGGWRSEFSRKGRIKCRRPAIGVTKTLDLSVVRTAY